jgi:hypothetical protein
VDAAFMQLDLHGSGIHTIITERIRQDLVTALVLLVQTVLVVLVWWCW